MGAVVEAPSIDSCGQLSRKIVKLNLGENPQWEMVIHVGRGFQFSHNNIV